MTINDPDGRRFRIASRSFDPEQLARELREYGFDARAADAKVREVLRGQQSGSKRSERLRSTMRAAPE